jgi:XTP/dITP diphosphohydrolase
LNFKLKNNRLKNKDKLFLIKIIAMKLVFATNNLNKLKELQSLIPEHIELLSLKDIGCFEDVPETQLTIKGNAIQKAEYIKKHYGFDCFADDTGLEVEMLNGEPGVFSARYAGAQRDANDNMDLLLNNLKNKHGDQGFGYDPIFKAKGYHKTFAEISLQEKNTIGHRGKAVRLLVDFLNNL